MRQKQFKAESKRLLDMMINSIYTHKEIFLREIISNASDAIDKLYFKSLTDTSITRAKSDYGITLTIDKENRTLTISDNGIGMTAQELETNLGTIAKSGSLAFKKDNELGDDVDIIGQFGVGFYSAFMVASEVTVISRAYGEDMGNKWVSKGADGYTIEECHKDIVGTDIILKIKDNTDDENYDEYLEQYRIQNLVKKYSDYIRYPIKMDFERSRLKEGSEDEYEEYTETVTMNTMVPIWKKNKSELKDEDYNEFYKDKFHDFENPALHIHSKTEGLATYDALLYIPSRAPYDYYSKDYEKGLSLYSSGVMIMDKCADLLPDYFSFVKGLVDSQDLSLNISRELLQHDKQLKVIAKNIEKAIKNELAKMLKNNREEYEKFFKNFGLQLKFGIYQSYGMNKELLQDLLIFPSSFEGKQVTLAEYTQRMKEDQKYIYYAIGETSAKIEMLPQIELLKDKGFEVLYFTDDVDEFAIKMIGKYNDKDFKSITSGDLDLEDDAKKEELKKQSDENKDLFELMTKSLDGAVTAVRLSSRLKSHAVCLAADGEISLEMEKVMNAMPNMENGAIKAQRVLEINPDHAVFAKLKNLYNVDNDKIADYAKLLYNQALLIEGMKIENPVEYANLVCKLMTE